jgi:Transposase DDE domain
MAKRLVSHELWELIEPLIPKVPRRQRFGSQAARRPEGVGPGLVRVADGDPLEVAAAGDGLRLGDDLLAPLARVAGVGRLAAAVRAAARQAERGGIDDWSRAAIDSSHVRAFEGREDRPEPSRPLKTRLQAPPDRLRARHAAHGLTDRRQPQRHQRDDPAGRRDPTRAWTARPFASPTAASLWRPRLPLTRVSQRAAPPPHPGEIAVPKSPHGSGLGKPRWAVEHTIAWLHQYRRLRIRYERRDHIHEAFLASGCSLICLKLLNAETSLR